MRKKFDCRFEDTPRFKMGVVKVIKYKDYTFFLVRKSTNNFSILHETGVSILGKIEERFFKEAYKLFYALMDYKITIEGKERFEDLITGQQIINPLINNSKE